MKWTTREDSSLCHWYGFHATDRRAAPCSRFCKSFVRNGVKYVTHYMTYRQDGKLGIDKHNPPCSTERCRRRGKK